MSGEKHPKLENVDLDTSYVLGVIYDDVSLTLEMDFHLLEGHPRFEHTDAEEGCYRKGFIRFSDMEDLRLKKTRAADSADLDLSVIESATLDGEYFHMLGGWGEIELTASSIRIAID
ncbi:hypothetical protein SAMN06297468_2564 [Altererythrobacter xiamenensis]|uniref:Immunity protein 50 n=1 Tax=Altererythrobacter xiamenensis TaxID=1316679 RepID=A0A1Y6FNA0_9SPHN|nr:hypothetical protein [Altererythrobacter xiamenensis]SMQ74332.1 hypothetical protein SAMN06297468_2564 [Altererythrobacter xiamenensis]